jgi:endoglycosylceramidase
MHARTTTTRRLAAAALALALAAGACSGSDSPESADVTDATNASEVGTDSRVDPPGRPLLDVAAMSTTTGADGQTYLADGDGRALQLRGANIKTTDPAADADTQALDDLADRGFDLLRLSVYWHLLEPTKGEYDEAYLDEIQEALDRAQERGINVILSFHQDVFGPAFGNDGIPEWATRTDDAPFEKQDMWFMNYLQPAVQNAWEHLYEDDDLRQAQADAWALVAERFGDHPATLGYDLLNEPFGKQRDGEDLATAAERVQRTQLADMQTRLIDAMREHDPDGWMFFAPPNVALLGLPVTLRPPEDERAVFFPHLYDPAVEGANYAGEGAELDLSFFERAEPMLADYALTNDLPMLVGEWGISDPELPGMDIFVDESLDLMDRIASGWTVFTWCRGDGYCVVAEDGTDRPNIGQVVRPWPRAIAGTPAGTTYESETDVLTVKVVAADADHATELVVTDGWYPHGFQVRTSLGDEGWTTSSDPDTGIVSVNLPGGEDVTICLGPEGAQLTCV